VVAARGRKTIPFVFCRFWIGTAALAGAESQGKTPRQKREKELRSDEEKTSGWLFLRQGALPTTGGPYLRALLPLYGLSEAHRQRICYQCDHRNFGH